MLKQYGQLQVYKIIHPFIQLLIKLKVTPNMITTVGFVLNVLAAGIFMYGAEYGERGNMAYIGWGGLTILFAGLFDMIDGRLARMGHMSSPFGALYDSVLDRYCELIMFLGICYYLVSHDYFLSSIFAFIAMIGSVMVSYIRARAESLGARCDVGWMQRPERILLIGLSAISCWIAAGFLGGDFKVQIFSLFTFETISFFTLPLTFLAITANQTAFSRLLYAKKELQNKN
ncbi:MAG TPA: CDP-alcohol phosphatidyltransferase family protein [Phaeodactylibacter sp.]|nr:CDP-alcohol phosphatidyltransferase family protein [Phaeodactylibacter sp.]